MMEPLNMPSAEILKSAFQDWLIAYEMFDTTRWSELYSKERDTLAEMQWLEFLECLTIELNVRTETVKDSNPLIHDPLIQWEWVSQASATRESGQ